MHSYDLEAATHGLGDLAEDSESEDANFDGDGRKRTSFEDANGFRSPRRKESLVRGGGSGKGGERVRVR